MHDPQNGTTNYGDAATKKGSASCIDRTMPKRGWVVRVGGLRSRTGWDPLRSIGLDFARTRIRQPAGKHEWMTRPEPRYRFPIGLGSRGSPQGTAGLARQRPTDRAGVLRLLEAGRTRRVPTGQWPGVTAQHFARTATPEPAANRGWMARAMLSFPHWLRSEAHSKARLVPLTNSPQTRRGANSHFGRSEAPVARVLAQTVQLSGARCFTDAPPNTLLYSASAVSSRAANYPCPNLARHWPATPISPNLHFGFSPAWIKAQRAASILSALIHGLVHLRNAVSRLGCFTVD